MMATLHSAANAPSRMGIASTERHAREHGNATSFATLDDAQAIVRQIESLKKKLGRDWPKLPVGVLVE
jgi:hypothetical protein